MKENGIIRSADGVARKVGRALNGESSMHPPTPMPPSSTGSHSGNNGDNLLYSLSMYPVAGILLGPLHVLCSVLGLTDSG